MKKVSPNKQHIKIKVYIDNSFHHSESFKQFVYLRNGETVIHYCGGKIPVHLDQDSGIYFTERRVRTIQVKRPKTLADLLAKVD